MIAPLAYLEDGAQPEFTVDPRESFYDAFYRQHADDLRNYLYRSLRHKGLEGWTEPEDLAQEAFLKLLGSYPERDDPEELGRLLYTIAKNQIADLGRQKQGRRGQIHKAASVLEGKDKKDDEYFEVEDTVERVRETTGASAPLTPDEVFERNEKKAGVWRVLDALTERARLIIELWSVDGPLTPEEIAAELGVTVKSLPTTIGRAKDKFKVEYRRPEEEEDTT